MQRSKSRLNPFPSAPYVAPKSQGGAKPGVQQASDDFRGGGSLAERMYAPPAIANFDQSDPRYDGKSDNVENIYLPPPPEPQAPRSGVAQLFNWLTTGVFR